MIPKTLRVRAAGDSLVQNYERLDAGVNEFVGRKLVELEGKPGQFGRVPTGEVVELPYRVEYIRHLQSGDLTPADEETAKTAGLEFKGDNQ